MIEGVGCIIEAQHGAKTEEECTSAGLRKVPLTAQNIADLEQQHLAHFAAEVMLVQGGLQLLDWCVTGQFSFFLARTLELLPFAFGLAPVFTVVGARSKTARGAGTLSI